MLPHSISIGDFNHIDETKEYQRFLMHGLGLTRGLILLTLAPTSRLSLSTSMCLHSKLQLSNDDNKSLGKHVANFIT